MLSFHLDVVKRSVYIHEIMIMSRRECKLDRLKMNPRGATKEAPICAVPMHAPQTIIVCEALFGKGWGR